MTENNFSSDSNFSYRKMFICSFSSYTKLNSNFSSKFKFTAVSEEVPWLWHKFSEVLA